ncbi:hypothetical protein D9M68_734170 [compost metagenome]
MAGGRPGDEGRRRRLAPYPLLQLRLRSASARGELPAARPFPSLRVHADAGTDQGAHGRPGNRTGADQPLRRSRQVRGQAPPGLHLQRPGGQGVAQGARVPGRRCRAHDPAVHGPGHEFGCARRLQPGVETGSRAVRQGVRQAARHLRQRALPPRQVDDRHLRTDERFRFHGQPGGKCPPQPDGQGARSHAGGWQMASRRRFQAHPYL